MKRPILLFVTFVGIAFCLLLYKCRQPDYIRRYDKAMTYSDTVKKGDVDFPLPASSSDIYYGMYGDWQAYTKIVRFKAPVEDCIRHIDSVIAWNDKLYNRTSSYRRKNVSRVERQPAGWLEPANWFCPDTITNGLYVGEASSHKPQIWIDLDKGIFYYYESD